MQAIGVSRNKKVVVEMNDNKNILRKTRKAQKIHSSNSCIFSIEGVHENGSPDDGAVILAEMLFNYTLIPQGKSTYTWVKIDENNGNCKAVLKILDGHNENHYLQSLLRFVMYDKSDGNLTPLAQIVWPVSLLSAKCTNRNLNGTWETYDPRSLEEIFNTENCYQELRNTQKIRSGTASKKRGRETDKIAKPKKCKNDNAVFDDSDSSLSPSSTDSSPLPLISSPELSFTFENEPVNDNVYYDSVLGENWTENLELNEEWWNTYEGNVYYL